MVRLAEAMAQRRLRRWLLCIGRCISTVTSLSSGFTPFAGYPQGMRELPPRRRRSSTDPIRDARSRIYSRNPVETRVYRSYPTSRNPVYALVHLFKTYRSTSRTLPLAPAPIPCPMIHCSAHSPPFQIETYGTDRRGGRKCRLVGGRW